MSETAVSNAKPIVDTSEWTPPPGALRSLTYHLIARTARILFWLFFRWKVIGLENVPRSGGVLLASNHASHLDPPLVGAAVYGYRPCRIMAKSELWKNRLFGKLIEQLGGFPVQRHSADRATLRRVLDWLKAQESVLLFVEGERTPDGTLQPAQPGIALLVQKGGVPVVPVACMGTYVAWSRGRKFPRPAPLKIVFGAPLIFPSDAKREDVTAALMRAIADLMTANGQPTTAPSQNGRTKDEG